MTKQIVFIVRSATARIREAEAEITICEKWTWAQVKSRRHLLGTSAFFTRKAAERCKLGMLRKVAETHVLGSMFRTRGLYHAANTQLDTYNKTGVIH